MNGKRTVKNNFFVFSALIFGVIVWGAPVSSAQNNSGPVELNGNTLEYSLDGDVVTAEGNVIVKNKDITLYCDRVTFYRTENIAVADGNVRLVQGQGELWGTKLTFNFETQTGNFHNARIFSHPYYATGRKISKVAENQMVVQVGRVTTSDYDKPRFYIDSKKMDVYPGDKLIARHIKVYWMDIPIMYFPRYTQDLSDKKPFFHFTPGRTGEWGPFLLTEMRYYHNQYLTAVAHVDYRQKRGPGYGVDLEYKTPSTGAGLLRTYYTVDDNENDTVTARDQLDRYKFEWRHKWDVDNKTTAIAQYYRLSDSEFLKDFFEREYDQDSDPQSFFLLTRAMPKGTMSVRADARVHNFTSDVDRLPEVRYDLNNQELGETGFYVRNQSIFSSLTTKVPKPGSTENETVRMHMDNELSYPTKIGFLEVKPFAGSRDTFYSNTVSNKDDRTIRHQVRGGTSFSTKFYKLFDLDRKLFGQEYDRMRHIITPTLAYQYEDTPSLTNSEIIQIDGVDTLSRTHNVNFSIENKLQVKRKNKNGEERTVELLRAIVGTDHRLRHDFRDSGFDAVTTDIDFRPTDWLRFYFDSSYDTRNDRLSTANLDMFIDGGEKWDLELSRRFNNDVDDQVTAIFNYFINPKWKFRMYQRLDIEEGVSKEQEYTLTRDLHSWEMDININRKDQEGLEILLLFRLKAFPEIGFDFGTEVGRRESGSQDQ